MRHEATLAGTLIIAQASPIITSSDSSLIEYAVTQGGLLAFALVLLYFYRRDNFRIQAKDEEKIAVLVDLVAETKAAIIQAGAAIEKQSDAIHHQSHAIDQLATIVRAIEERRLKRSTD